MAQTPVRKTTERDEAEDQERIHAPLLGPQGHAEAEQCDDLGFLKAWNSHRDYLHRLSMLWMNISATDAEDALSDATIRAFEKYKKHFHNINNERAWFARLLHNICIDRHRSNRRRFQLGERVKEVNTIDDAAFDKVELTPEAQLLNTELGRNLAAAIYQLPEKLRTPLVMRLVHGEEYDIIARHLGISNDNARKRVQQARALLRKSLSEFKPFLK